MQKNILVVGGDSFLGSALVKKLSRRQGMNVYSTSRRDSSAIHFDLLQPANFSSILTKYKIGTVFWVAAIKDVKFCEENKDLSKKINLDSVIQSFEQVKNLESKPQFFFISSDYVFDPTTGDNTADSPKNPHTMYGKLKSQAEDYLLSQKGPVIVRTAAILGKGGVFWDWLLKKLENPEPLSMFSNSYFTPTSLNYLCEVLGDLVTDINLEQQRIKHICGHKKFSRFELAKLIQESSPERFKAPLTAEVSTQFLKQDTSMKSNYSGLQPNHTDQTLINEVFHV